MLTMSRLAGVPAVSIRVRNQWSGRRKSPNDQAGSPIEKYSLPSGPNLRSCSVWWNAQPLAFGNPQTIGLRLGGRLARDGTGEDQDRVVLGDVQVVAPGREAHEPVVALLAIDLPRFQARLDVGRTRPRRPPRDPRGTADRPGRRRPAPGSRRGSSPAGGPWPGRRRADSPRRGRRPRAPGGSSPGRRGGRKEPVGSRRARSWKVAWPQVPRGGSDRRRPASRTGPS